MFYFCKTRRDKMKPEIRIYFECLEQLLHYILPLVKEGLAESKIDAGIKFIRKPKRLIKPYGSLAAIYALTTPDIMITMCKDNKEIPLVMGEFSEAVTTEDHELQRAMGGIAAALSGCIYLKISGQKQSVKEHGGKKDFDPLTIPKIIKQTYGYDGYIFGKWPVSAGNPYVLERDKVFLSCPPKSGMPIIEETLKLAVREGLKNYDEILANKTTIFDCISSDLKRKDYYQQYIKLIEGASGLKELVSDWKSRKGKGENKEPRILLDDSNLIVKINRFSHAADPDRGILIFASTLVPAKTVFTRYCVKEQCSKTADLITEFIKQALEEGLPKNFMDGFGKCLNRNISEHIDITEFVAKSKKEWERNKVLHAIFLFSDGMVIHDKKCKCRIQLTWNRKTIFGMAGNMGDILNNLFGFKKYDRPLRISEVNDIDEDEVSYIVVHKVLMPNMFDIVSVSYPGAQGDAAILPEKSMGRSQSRMYIDIIAWLPKSSSTSGDITLEENKDAFDTKEMEKLIERLNLFRTDKQMFEALGDTLSRLNQKKKLEHIFIGVAFGVENIKTEWEPHKVDYLIRIFDRTKWQIASFGKELKDAFKIVEGEVTLPKIYRVIDAVNEIDLLDFVEDNESNE